MRQEPLTGLSPMPFGKHKGEPMQDVPALGAAAITGTLGTFHFTSAGRGSVIMTGDSSEMAALESRIRLRVPAFTLGLAADSLHGYKAHCILTEPVAALVFSEVFRSLTRP